MPMIQSCTAVLKLHIKLLQFSSKLLTNCKILFSEISPQCKQNQLCQPNIIDIGLHVTTLTGLRIKRVSEYNLGIWLD